MNNSISRDELHRKLVSNTRPTIVEALAERYYADKHLPGAINIPHDRVDALAPSLLPDKDAEIVVYCSNLQCQNSHVAAHRLTTLGYTNVVIYRDGKQDWEQAGLPLETTADANTGERVSA